MSRTVAILAPDFPPSGMPSSTRPRLFASHLREFGWTPVVIATNPEYYENAVDPDNEKLLAAGVEVIRTKAWRAAATRRFGLGDLGIRSLWHSWRALRELVRSRKVDLVFISVPPNMTMLLGRLARVRLGIPYVVDYQDPWLTDAWWRVEKALRPPKWPIAWAMARFLEPWAIRRAAAVTGVSLRTTDRVGEINAAIPRTEIPFGAEPAEFGYLRAHPRKNAVFAAGDGGLHLVYTGAVIPGMFPAVRALLGGVRELVAREPEMAARLCVHFVGTSYGPGAAKAAVLPIARELGVADRVTEQTARASYLDALQMVVDSSALVVLGSDEPHYTPSKIFAYALSGRPVLALLHEAGPAPAMLRSISDATVLTYGAAAGEVAEALKRLLAQGGATVDEARLAPYTAKAMTARLAAVFDKAVA